jgi:prepilin-type N-terminal cleavage/methylation domain-containing protein
MRASRFFFFPPSRQGWTLTELMVAMAVASLMTAGLVTGVISIERSFVASRHHIEAQAQQMRLMDYMTLDLRRALKVDTGNGTLTVTIPDYYDANGAPRDAQISGGQAVYGPQPVTIQYYKSGATIYRCAGNTSTALASDVADFQLSFLDAGQSIQIGVTFVPTYQFDGNNTENVRIGTAIYTNTLLRNKRQY